MRNGNGNARRAAVDLDTLDRELKEVVPFVPREPEQEITSDVEATAALDYASDSARLAAGETPRAGMLSAEAMEQLCNQSADAVQREVEHIGAMSDSLREEGKALADAIRRHGKTYADDTKRFALMVVNTREAMSQQRGHFQNFMVRDPQPQQQAAAE